MKDPIVEEVRQIRQEHAERFGFDLDAICEDIRKRELLSERRIVRFQSRRIPEKQRQNRIS